MQNAIDEMARMLVVLVTIGTFLIAGGACRSYAAEGASGTKQAASAKKPAAKTPAAKKPAAKKPAAKKPAATEERAAAIGAVKEMVEGEDVLAFRAFCDSWMQKLRERDAYNLAHITWTKVGTGGVAGEYLSYGTTRTCIARQEPGKDPIGKITYREIRYRREGATTAAAMAGASTIVEQTDVTEIFRYAKGSWQY